MIGPQGQVVAVGGKGDLDLGPIDGLAKEKNTMVRDWTGA